MHFLELLNTELHFSAGIQTQRKPPNTGNEPVRYATVAWATRIKSRCQCSNDGHVMVCNCSDTDTYWTAPPISWLLRNHALSRWNNNNVAPWKELKVHYIISDIKQKAWNLHFDNPYFHSCGKRDFPCCSVLRPCYTILLWTAYQQNFDTWEFNLCDSPHPHIKWLPELLYTTEPSIITGWSRDMTHRKQGWY
jgi:hypothetical protein